MAGGRSGLALSLRLSRVNDDSDFVAWDRSALEGFKVLELRHTFVALWVDAGANVKEVSVRAGHCRWRSRSTTTAISTRIARTSSRSISTTSWTRPGGQVGGSEMALPGRQQPLQVVYQSGIYGAHVFSFSASKPRQLDALGALC